MIRCSYMDHNGQIVYWKSEQFSDGSDTLFFLHGLTADHTMFDQQVLYFEKEFNIITWDAPAHGLSKTYADFSYANAAEAMKGILDCCGVRQVILVGQSMGGFISQAFIFRYPEMVKGFAAIDSCPYGNYYSRSDIWILKQVEWMAMLYPEKLLKSAMISQTAVTDRGRANMRAMIGGYTKRELSHLMGIGYRGFIDDNREMTIGCPVLLLCGEKDRTGKVKTYNKEWNRKTGYPLIWIQNAAHNSNVDNPEAVNRSIMEFVKGID